MYLFIAKYNKLVNWFMFTSNYAYVINISIYQSIYIYIYIYIYIDMYVCMYVYESCLICVVFSQKIKKSSYI